MRSIVVWTVEGWQPGRGRIRSWMASMIQLRLPTIQEHLASWPWPVYTIIRRFFMVRDEFEFYDANQAEIVAGHLDEFVVIKDRKVRGYYKTDGEAFDSMIGEEIGTFMVKRCQKPGTDIINYYNDRVVFA
jgi:phospholipase C